MAGYHCLMPTAFLPLRSQMPPRRGLIHHGNPAIKCEMAWLLAFFITFAAKINDFTWHKFYYINVRTKTSNINTSFHPHQSLNLHDLSPTRYNTTGVSCRD